VPALTGAIMCMGVATANSVLVANFARQRYAKLGDPVRRRSKPASSGSGRC
jgi:multidrug efflux pump subunit AcrB